MANEQVNVSVADDELGRFAEVVRSMRDAGLEVEQELEALGVVSGSIAPDKLPNLRQVKGVTAVETARTYRLPPPDSPVQ